MEAKDLKTEVEGVLLDLEMLVEEYNIETDLTEVIPVEGLDGRLSRLMKVGMRDFNVYLLETPYLLRYVTHPHIVGEPLRNLFEDNSSLLKKAMARFMLERFGRPVLAHPMGKLMGIEFPVIDELSNSGDLVLIFPVPPTELSYLEEIRERVRDRGGRVTVAFFFGPMSSKDVRRLGEASDSLGMDSIFLSTVLLGGEDSAGRVYAYGPDIELLKSGKVLGVGSIMDRSTLCRLLRDYPPSIDISRLEARVSDDPAYLKTVLEEILFLLEQPVFEPWQIEVLMREAKSLKRQLIRYGS